MNFFDSLLSFLSSNISFGTFKDVKKNIKGRDKKPPKGITPSYSRTQVRDQKTEFSLKSNIIDDLSKKKIEAKKSYEDSDILSGLVQRIAFDITESDPKTGRPINVQIYRNAGDEEILDNELTRSYNNFLVSTDLIKNLESNIVWTLVEGQRFFDTVIKNGRIVGLKFIDGIKNGMNFIKHIDKNTNNVYWIQYNVYTGEISETIPNWRCINLSVCDYGDGYGTPFVSQVVKKVNDLTEASDDMSEARKNSYFRVAMQFPHWSKDEIEGFLDKIKEDEKKRRDMGKGVGEILGASGPIDSLDPRANSLNYDKDIRFKERSIFSKMSVPSGIVPGFENDVNHSTLQLDLDSYQGGLCDTIRTMINYQLIKHAKLFLLFNFSIPYESITIKPVWYGELRHEKELRLKELKALNYVARNLIEYGIIDDITYAKLLDIEKPDREDVESYWMWRKKYLSQENQQ